MRHIVGLLSLLLVLAYAPAIRAADGIMDMSGHSMPGHSMPAAAPAATAAAGPVPQILVAPRQEEGKRMLGATVTLAGKPLVGAKVNFYVERSFGLLDIGQDESLDDGVAAVKFPEGLPGGTVGKLHIIAKVAGTARYAPAAGDVTVPADIVVVPDPDPFPRAIWAPHAPIPLILTLAIALGGVWTTYVFVLLQLRAIRKAGHP